MLGLYLALGVALFAVGLALAFGLARAAATHDMFTDELDELAAARANRPHGNVRVIRPGLDPEERSD